MSKKHYADRNLKFETLQLHVGQETPDPVTDARAVPIYLTSSYVFHNSEHAADRFGLRDAGNIYGRLTNPTEDVFERRIAALEGGVAALAVGSGAAALTYAFQAVAHAGDHIVAAKNIYGGTYNLLAHTLPDYGIEATFVDPFDYDGIKAAIKENTKAIEIENAVAKEVNYYVEELHDILDANADKVDKYNIHIKRIERQIDKIASKINGTIDNELCKKVSLDNTECKEIVKMIPGSKKEEAMNTFLDQSVNSALESCCKEIRNSLEEIYEDVETEVLGAVDTIQKQNELLKESLASVDENNYEVTAKEQMVEAYYMIDVCDAVSQIL